MKVRIVSAGIYEELALLCCFFLLGVVLAASYDILRIFRGLVPHGTLLINIEDLFYWIYVAVVVFVTLYEKNDGRLRGYVFGALVVGMLLYTVSFGRICVPPLIRFLKKIESILLRPFRRACTFVGAQGEKGRKKCGKLWLILKKRLKKLWKMVKIGLCKL